MAAKKTKEKKNKKTSTAKSAPSFSLWTSNKVTMFILVVLSWILGIIILFSCGMFGRFMQEVLQLLFGSFTYVLLLAIMGVGLNYVWNLGETKIPRRVIIGFCFFGLFWMLSFGIALTRDNNAMYALSAVIASLGEFSTMSFTSTCGLIGAMLAGVLSMFFSRAGAVIFALAFFVISVVLTGWRWWRHLLADRAPKEERKAKRESNPGFFTRLRMWSEEDFDDEETQPQKPEKKRPPRMPYGQPEEVDETESASVDLADSSPASNVPIYGMSGDLLSNDAAEDAKDEAHQEDEEQGQSDKKKKKRFRLPGALSFAKLRDKMFEFEEEDLPLLTQAKNAGLNDIDDEEMSYADSMQSPVSDRNRDANGAYADLLEDDPRPHGLSSKMLIPKSSFLQQAAQAGANASVHAASQIASSAAGSAADAAMGNVMQNANAIAQGASAITAAAHAAGTAASTRPARRKAAPSRRSIEQAKAAQTSVQTEQIAAARSQAHEEQMPDAIITPSLAPGGFGKPVHETIIPDQPAEQSTEPSLPARSRMKKRSARRNEDALPPLEERTFGFKQETMPMQPKEQQSFDGYKLPPVSLLQEPKTKKTNINQKKAIEQGNRLIAILKQFGVEATLGEIHIGPSVTEFEVIPGHGVRVNAFVNLQSDIKLALAAKDIRIEAPIPGKSAVGIEVPNEEKTTVSMKELITQVPSKLDKQPLVFTLGKDLMGDNIYGRLDTMPHLLIAGATGSGKSVCVNSIICSILMRTRPDEVKLLLVDPKKVEFTPFNGLPHLLSPVITDAALASGALKIIVDMMDERYSLFEAYRVRNIAGYNEYAKRHPKENLPKMPRIVVIIDELADLMLAASKDVEQSIQRITQLARAAGIHLIVATQRPSVNVITGVIKANIPSRIAFMVSSRTDSRTILDQSGAEKLLGYGDMLFLDNGAASPKRIQGVFIQDREVEAICEFVRAQASPEYEEPFLVLKETKNTAADDDSFEEDPLYNEVRHFVIVSRKASTSLIQRRFRIGYARAARILDQLEANRIVGPAQGSKPREILFDGGGDVEDY